MAATAGSTRFEVAVRGGGVGGVRGGVVVGDRTGSGGPAVVFLHAAVADRRSWPEVVADLAGGGFDGTLVSYDRRGYGDSPPSPPGDWTHLADLLAVLDEVSPDAPAWLVGSSMGGGLALQAAVTAPDRVAGLVLIAPAAGGPEYADNPPAADELAARHQQAYADRDRGEINRVEAHLWLDGPLAPEGRVGGAVRERFLAMNAVALGNEGDEPAGESDVDTWRPLPDIAAPVTLVYGALDADVPREDPPLFVQQRPATSWEIWPDRSHLPYLEDPHQTAELVRRALATAP